MKSEGHLCEDIWKPDTQTLRSSRGIHRQPIRGDLAVVGPALKYYGALQGRLLYVKSIRFGDSAFLDTVLCIGLTSRTPGNVNRDCLRHPKKEALSPELYTHVPKAQSTFSFETLYALSLTTPIL